MDGIELVIMDEELKRMFQLNGALKTLTTEKLDGKNAKIAKNIYTEMYDLLVEIESRKAML